MVNTNKIKSVRIQTIANATVLKSTTDTERKLVAVHTDFVFFMLKHTGFLLRDK